MGFSVDADQQRSHEAAALKRFLGVSLAGSLLLHGISLLLPVADPRTASKPRLTEVTIVPRRSSVETPPLPNQSPNQLPKQPPEQQPEQQPEPFTQTDLSELPTALLEQLAEQSPSTLAPEGDPNAVADESPLVGSGLTEGTGGFAEGIGLNRSNSPIRGTGGGARRGVVGGAPVGIPRQDPPVATAPPAPQLEVVAPEPASAQQAICRRCPSPDYPRAALQANVEGRVQVSVDVDAEGRVVQVRMANSSGNREIDQAVLETVRERWRFEDIRGGVNNVPVEVYMTVDGSELNQQVQDWGQRTAVEIPTSGFAASPTAPDAAVEETSVEETSVEAQPPSSREPQPSPQTPIQPAQPSAVLEADPIESVLDPAQPLNLLPASEPAPESNAPEFNAVEAEPIESTADLLEAEPPSEPVPVPEAASEYIPESIPAPISEPLAEPLAEPLFETEPLPEGEQLPPES
jgi:TonB family protein